MVAFYSLLAQNVGIGTTTPGAPLHIYNNSTDELVRVQGTNPYIGFRTLAGTLKTYAQGYGDHLLLGTAIGNPNGEIRFYNNNIANMVILPNGNVGIGNITPGAPLSFPNLLGNKISFWRNGPNNDFGIGINSGVMQLYTAGQDKIAFGWGNANAFNETITFYTGSGRIGLGTANPEVKLHIAQDNEALRLSGNQSYISFYNGNTYKGYMWNNAGNIEIGTDGLNVNGEINLKTKGLQGLSVQSDGRVRVGALGCTILTSAGIPKLSTSGPLGFKKAFGDQIGEWAIGYYDYSGELLNTLSFFFNGGIKALIDAVDGSWETFSDSRLKENFKDYKSVLHGIRKLNVSTYHYKADKTGKRSFGFIAQNLQQYFPELVSGSSADKDRYLAIDYGKTGVLAIKAIQEQQEIIESQQKKIDLINKEIATLKEQNEKLRSAIDKLTKSR